MCNPGPAPSVDAECQPLEGARNYAWADAITLCLSATSPPVNLLANWSPKNTPIGTANSCDYARKVKRNSELN